MREVTRVMPNQYKTSEIAKKIGIHHNTVRLYEKYGLISKPKRSSNGYRIYTDLHLEQFRLARTALKVEVLQNGLRKMAINIIKLTASGRFEEAENIAMNYMKQIKTEQKNAESAIEIASQLLSGDEQESDVICLTRKETSDCLQISMDTLRNWEMNGLLTVKRKISGYRVYSHGDIRRLKIIRSLRCANYSLAAILRMLTAISRNPRADLKTAIDTPCENEDIISVCDKLLTSLHNAEKNAQDILIHLDIIRNL